MIVNNDNKIEIRNVKTGAAVGNRWLVTEGLQPGDRVVVEGLQKIRPGSQVKAVPWEDPLNQKAETATPEIPAEPVEKAEMPTEGTAAEASGAAQSAAPAQPLASSTKAE